MRKAIKYISVTFLFLLVFSTFSFASNIDMNLAADNTLTSNTTQNTTTLTTVSGTAAAVEDGLTIGNIINIFLAVVGVVLILLGLAILVRLKY